MNYLSCSNVSYIISFELAQTLIFCICTLCIYVMTLDSLGSFCIVLAIHRVTNGRTDSSVVQFSYLHLAAEVASLPGNLQS
jgi:hypothetical protein